MLNQSQFLFILEGKNCKVRNDALSPSKQFWPDPDTSSAGFPRRLESLENKNGHGKVMEHAKLAKKSWNFTNFTPNLY